MFEDRRPTLTVIACFYNMRREARRTLYSLTPEYQHSVSADDYAVVAVDNGSSAALDPRWVASLAPNFSHVLFETESQSPCQAINTVVRAAQSDHVMILIDGARILTPGILKYFMMAAESFAHYFAYTLSMHLGHELQNEGMLKGYDQKAEDELLRTVDWRTNGYSLFSVGCLAGSSRRGPLAQPAESNCFTLRRDDFLRVGGYEERFQAPGGGTANLELFNRLNRQSGIQPVMLLGEATFHQFHGGVTTNVPPELHPLERNRLEYLDITGATYELFRRDPILFGHWPAECADLFRLDTAT